MIDLVAGGAWTGQTSLSGRAGAISNQKEPQQSFQIAGVFR
jgi:hypothetical protein